MDEYIGIIKLFGGTFAPKGWAFCNGQLLNINQYSALYAVLGNTYGGNGSQFALPNLQGRVPVGMGQGTGLAPINQGEMGGANKTTLTGENLPPHSHGTFIDKVNATTNDPSGGYLGMANYPDPTTGDPISVNVYTEKTTAQAQNITTTGNGTPASIMQPYIGMNYIICLEGLFPPRS